MQTKGIGLKLALRPGLTVSVFAPLYNAHYYTPIVAWRKYDVLCILAVVSVTTLARGGVVSSAEMLAAQDSNPRIENGGIGRSPR